MTTMRSRLLHHDNGRRIYALLFDKGDDPLSMLTRFAEKEDLTASSMTGIGAFSRSVLGYFDPRERDYLRKEVPEQCEVLSFAGGTAVGTDDRPAVHAHVVLGLRNFSAIGGHLLEADVWPTLEVVLTESPPHLRKKLDPDTGLALIR